MQSEINVLGCYNVELNRITHFYSLLGPCVRFSASTHLLEYKGQYFELLCIADACGFLTLTLGATQEEQRRIFTVQTSMWVKNVQFSFQDTTENDPERFVMVRRNQRLDTPEKLEDVDVRPICRILVFGTTQLHKGSVTI